MRNLLRSCGYHAARFAMHPASVSSSSTTDTPPIDARNTVRRCLTPLLLVAAVALPCVILYRAAALIAPCSPSVPWNPAPALLIPTVGELVDAVDLMSSNPHLARPVFNRQRQDKRLPRDGEQKSVVVLSCHPYSFVFRPLLQILGPLCCDIGSATLDLVASHVTAWPPPTPGSPMDRPIGGAALRVHLPSSSNDLAVAAAFPPCWIVPSTAYPKLGCELCRAQP